MVTTVVLIRHAKPITTAVPNDFTKPLSEEGKAIQHKVNLALQHSLITPDRIWYSPYTRAKETAAIIGRDFGIIPTEELSLGEVLDEDDLLQKLPSPDKNLCVFMVGHGPQLMRLATFFAGEPCYPFSPPTSSALVLDFTKEIAPGAAQLVKYFGPQEVW